MTTLSSTLVVRLLDQVSQPAKTISHALLGIQDAAGRATNLHFADRLQSALERNNRALDASRGKLFEAVAAGWALKASLGAAVTPAVSFEAAMADIAKVTDLSDEAITALGKTLRNIAVTEIPMSATDLAAITAAGAQSGIADSDLVAFTAMVAKVGVAWGTAAAETGDSLAKIKTALGLSIQQTQLYADAINSLSDETAASAPDMVEYSRRVAADGKIAGFAATEVLTFGAAMISAGAAPEVAATSMRNFARALTKGKSATKGQRKALEELGLTAEDVAKRMQIDAKGTSLDVLSRIAAAPAEQRMALMSAIFGDEARALMPLLADLPRLKEMLAEYAEQAKYAGSANAEFERRSRTAEYAIQRMKNAVVEVAMSIGDTLLPTIKDVSGAFVPIAQRISGVIQQFPEFTRAVVIGTAGLIGFKIALTGVQYAALLARGGLIAAIMPFAKFGKWANVAVTGAIGLQTALAAMNGAKLTGFQKFTTGLMGLVRAIPGIGMVGAALKGIGAVVAGISAPVAAVVAALVAGGVLVWKYWDRISSVMAGVGRAIGEQLAPVLETIRPALDWLAPIGNTIASGWNSAISALQAFGNWLGSFFSQEVLTDAQKAEWEQAGHDAANRMIEAIKSAFAGLVAWAAEIGAQIGDAIAAAASRAVNRVKGWFGLGDADAAQAPNGSITDRAAANNAGSGMPTYDLEGAASSIQSIQSEAPSIPIPTPRPAEAGAAAKQTMDGYNSALSNELSVAEQKIDAFMARIKQKMATSLTPTIRPKVDMSGISGAHADIGIE
ncbi:phage tail tape measure protein [Brucella intermedia]|uniref:phage tail tape measure protein n=1 Tax=Brucella intermedia TaxID=94625 RepID=UPI000468F8F4|nr:phage tail tape measure protein [Brucella intermedia]